MKNLPCAKSSAYFASRRSREAARSLGAKAFSKERDAPGNVSWHHVGEQKRTLAREKSRQKEEESVAYVIRLEPGGSSVIVAAKLSIEHAKEMAARLKEVGDPPGCCWCIGIWDEEEAHAKESTAS